MSILYALLFAFGIFTGSLGELESSSADEIAAYEEQLRVLSDDDDTN